MQHEGSLQRYKETRSTRVATDVHKLYETLGIVFDSTCIGDSEVPRRVERTQASCEPFRSPVLGSSLYPSTRRNVPANWRLPENGASACACSEVTFALRILLCGRAFETRYRRSRLSGRMATPCPSPPRCTMSALLAYCRYSWEDDILKPGFGINDIDPTHIRNDWPV